MSPLPPPRARRWPALLALAASASALWASSSAALSRPAASPPANASPAALSRPAASPPATPPPSPRLLIGAAPASADRFVATEVPDSPAGRQLAWLIDASTRLPIAEPELREHFTPTFLATPGATPAEVNAVLGREIDASGLRLVGLTQVKPDALVAVVTGRDARELTLMLAVDQTGLIAAGTLARVAPEVALPAPTGRAPVGTDVVGLVDPARAGRRLLLTRWYPAARAAGGRPRAAYASPLLTGALGLPPVRVHAREGARARGGALPVVLFSPGGGVPRVMYQALAEDLASHGYLVVAVDHTGEAPVDFPDGPFALPAPPPPIATWSATRLADMRLILRRLRTLPAGPRADRSRLAAIGHSLGGSTAAALMRVEPSVDAGVDMDGAIFGAARRGGVPRAFMVMTGGGGLDPTLRSMLRHSRGPRLALELEGLEHMSFSDLPVVAPQQAGGGGRREIAVQRAYLRAFLDRYVRGRRARLLEDPSTPRVRVRYRRDCCAIEAAAAR